MHLTYSHTYINIKLYVVCVMHSEMDLWRENANWNPKLYVGETEVECVFANVSMCSWVALGAPNAGIYSVPNECDI